MSTSDSAATPQAFASNAKTLLILLGLGVVVALIVGTSVERTGDIFDVDPALMKELNESTTPNPPPALVEKINADSRQAELKNAALFYGVFGMLAAGAFALGATLCGLRKTNPVVAIVSGALIGLVLGAAGGYAGEKIAHEIEVHEMDELMRSMCVHAAPFGLIGLAVGLAAGGVKGAVLGCVAGLLTVPIGDFGGQFLFPMELSLRSIPLESFHFTVWCLIAMSLCAVALGRGLSPAVPVPETGQTAGTSD